MYDGQLRLFALSPSEPILQLTNNASFGSGPPVPNALSVTFNNCIVYGSSQEQISLSDTLGDSTFHYLFDHCDVQTVSDTGANQSSFVSVLLNTPPIFNNQSNNDYTLGSGSPCSNYGKTGLNISLDLNCQSYYLPAPSIGCYEK